ncbi:MAG: glycosyltransferase family 2 protein [Azonexus sp.]|nr:glycosyltransferase family 2 protein [Azonexus sp.]
MSSSSKLAESLPLLTVAMPVFNAGSHLRLALLSIIQQSFADWELILIDDGSTDRAFEDVADIVDARIRIVRDGDNRGLAARLNEAIDLARGEFFARMDQDDISHPDRFNRQVAFLGADHSLDLVGARCVTISESNQVLGVLPGRCEHKEICRRPWLGFHLPHPTWMGRTAWFRKHRYAAPGPYCCEDQEFLLRTHEVSRFHVLPEYLLAYRLRDQFGFTKAWRTRRTLYGIQRQYFSNKGDLRSAGLALAGFWLRVAKDVWTLTTQVPFLSGCKASRHPNVSEANLETWQSIIEDLNGLHMVNGGKVT